MATPLDERTYGSAPYEEALAKAKARRLMGGNISLGNIIGRMLQRGALQASLQGLGAVPRGANFGTAFLAAAGGAGRAQAQMEQQASLDEYRAQQQANEERRMARLEQEKPKKPEPPPDPLLSYKLESARLKVEKQKYDLSHPKQPAGAKPKSAPKESAARLNKLRKEMAAFPHATPEELQMMATDATLEPETQRRAMAALRRYQNPQSPSQVPP